MYYKNVSSLFFHLHFYLLFYVIFKFEDFDDITELFGVGPWPEELIDG